MFDWFEVPIAIGIEMFEWFKMFEVFKCCALKGFDNKGMAIV